MSTTNAPTLTRGSLFKPVQRRMSEMFPIRVDGYQTTGEIHSVFGTRLDTGESVSVSLRKIEQKPGSTYERPEIINFAAEREYKNDPATKVGGVLLIEDAEKVAEGVYTSRWIRSLSHSMDEAEVMIVNAHCTGPKTTGAGKEYAALTFIHGGNIDHLSQEMIEKLNLVASGAVDDTQTLAQALEELLDSGVNAGVRICMGENFDALYVSTKPGVENKKRVEDFMERLPDEIKEAINSKSASCEIIPYGVLFAGKATIDIMKKSPTVRSRMARYHDQMQGRVKPYDVELFRPTIVAMRLTDPDPQTGARGVFMTHCEPLNTRYPVVGLREAICYTPTDLMAPVPPRPDALLSMQAPAAPSARQPSQQPQAAAPAAGAMDDGDEFSATGFQASDIPSYGGDPVSEEDIMQAAMVGGVDDMPPVDIPAQRTQRTQRAAPRC